MDNFQSIDVQSSIKEGLREVLKDITISPLQDPYNVMLTRNEVATMFKVHISTVDNWSSNGTLNPLGMGRKVYFRLSDVHKSITPLNL
jgi:hypothetical protein